MQILLTNDDGIYAPGLAAMERQLRAMGDVQVVAPLTEQSGVGHAITYLTPLMAREVFDEGNHRGWAVEGSPADCVKLAVAELCPQRPQLVVSGINYGQNSGINVLYSGTVAAAIEGAFFGITSIAVSLEYDDNPDYDRAAEIAAQLIQQVLQNKDDRPQLYNLNIPTAALTGTPSVKVVPMATSPWGEAFERRTGPRGKPYYWAVGKQPVTPQHAPTDLSELRQGEITLTPLDFDMTLHDELEKMRSWNLAVGKPEPAQ